MEKNNISLGSLAVYYGYPSLVNGSTSISQAANVFAAYDMVIFGQGIEDPAHPDHANTVNIIADPQMQNTQVFGYVDATIPYANIQTAVDQWESMAVHGIFFDQFGYDFSVSRQSQNDMVTYVHSKGMSAFVNAFNPDDAFSPEVEATYNPSGLETELGSEDWYLAESYQIQNDAYVSKTAWRSKVDKMHKYRESVGTQMAAVTTTASGAFSQKKWDWAYGSALFDRLDAVGWGEQNFSSISALLPWRARKQYYGNEYEGEPDTEGNIFVQQFNVGMRLNLTTHEVDTFY